MGVNDLQVRDVPDPQIVNPHDAILKVADDAAAGLAPSTWPRDELAIDVTHKAIYALATGAVVDRLARREGVSSCLR
jgi:hypothetical protein